MKLRTEIIAFLLGKSWVFGGDIERMPSIHKPSTISRELRRMSELGLLDKTLEKVGKVKALKYRLKIPEPEVKYPQLSLL